MKRIALAAILLGACVAKTDARQPTPPARADVCARECTAEGLRLGPGAFDPRTNACICIGEDEAHGPLIEHPSR